MNQSQLEQQYSRKAIRQHVIADIDMESEAYTKCISAVQQYMRGNYYASKDKRIKELQGNITNIDDIVIELFIAVLPIEDMSPIQSVAAQLGNRLGFRHLLDGVKTASEIIAVCELSGLYTLYHEQDHGNKIGTLGLQPNFSLNPETLEFIEQTMYLPPMICKPKNWINNVNGGHINGSGSVLLGSINHHSDAQNLDSLNTIQSIAWELNTHMLSKEEVPNKPLDTEDKRKQFKVLRDTSRHIYDEMLKLGNKFYFVWKYDKRGRMYSQGYHINLQSTQYKKSILQFKHKEKVSI